MADYCEHCGSIIEEDFVPITFGDLTISATRASVSTVEHTVKLTAKEGAMLAELVARAKKGQSASKEALLMRFFDDTDTEKGLEVYIHRLRARLRTINTKCVIETIWAQGYAITVKANDAAYGDLRFDRDRLLILKGNRSTHVTPKTFEVLELLLANKFVPIKEHAPKLFPNKNPEDAFRFHIMMVRKALKNVESTVAIFTTNPRTMVGAESGYWMRSAPAEEDRTKMPGGGNAGMIQSMTKTQKAFLEIWTKYPLLSYRDLSELANCTVDSAWRFAKALERKGFADDIIRQRKDFTDRPLTPTQEYFWNVIRDNPGLSKAALSKLAGSTTAAGYKMIDLLKSKGYVEEPPKRRRCLVAVDPNAPAEPVLSRLGFDYARAA